VLAAAMVSSLAAPARAAEAQPAAPAEPRYQVVAGPATVDLGDGLAVALGDGDLFLDRDNAARFVTGQGNQAGDDLRGIVTRKGATWIVEVSFDADGYVKDDDAARLDAGEILTVIRQGTAEANRYRQQHGFAAVTIDGWSDPPRYDRALHHVIWGVRGSSAGKSPGSTEQVINFNTRVLGRRGYASLNLIDDVATLASSKPRATALLRATSFQPGARYQDFDPASDKVAEYGLAALVAGGAGAANASMLAKLRGAFGGGTLFAGKKTLVVGAIAIGIFVAKLLGLRRKNQSKR
jgi:uncharacterized membrane-anchored protein